MSRAIDVYTPWRDAPECLLERHVGRAEPLRAIRSAIAAFARGGAPVHLYLFGPRGMGKSHVLALGRNTALIAAETPTPPMVTVPEDIPELGTADALLSRVASLQRGPSWLRWGEPIGDPLGHGPLVVFIEGLDRQLHAMSAHERRRLRGLLDERGPFLLIGTGLSLSDPFTNHDEAFYGAFSAWPIHALDDDEAGALLSRVSDSPPDDDAWRARRQALVTLAGGCPRTLVALGQSCAAEPTAWASAHLYGVVQQFTAHYQMRFRDLSPQQQAAVEVLALAPRELSPTELGALLGISTSHASGLCHRLGDGGVLLSRSEGRSSWYRIAEPLFRFWMEYRNAPWEQTRAGLLGHLIEAVLAPEALAQLWLDNPDPELQGAVEEVLRKDVRKRTQTWGTLARDYAGAVQAGDLERQAEIVRRSGKSDPPAGPLAVMAEVPRPAHTGARDVLRPLLERKRWHHILAAWNFEDDVSTDILPRSAYPRMLHGAARALSGSVPPRASWDAFCRVVFRALALGDPRGRSWVLEWDERAALARLPVLRGAALDRGKRHTHPPLIDPDDVLVHGMATAALDWDLLFSAAAQRGHRGLTGALVHVGLALPRTPPIPVCLSPGVPSAGGDDWPRLMARRIEEHTETWVSVLTWIGSCSEASAEAWSSFIDALAQATRRAPAQVATSWRVSRGLTLALVALGARRPERLDQLGSHLAGTAVEAIAVRAGALLRQLAEGERAHLYPELAAVKGWLESTSD